MKALTLIDPWGTLIAKRAKSIETRSWQASYRGPLAIHISQSKEYLDLAEEYPFCDFLTKSEQEGNFPFGKIVAICYLDKVERITATNRPPEPEASFGDYTPGRYAWHLKEVVTLPELGLEPIFVSGNRMLWNLPPEIEKIIQEALLSRLRQSLPLKPQLLP